MKRKLNSLYLERNGKVERRPKTISIKKRAESHLLNHYILQINEQESLALTARHHD